MADHDVSFIKFGVMLTQVTEGDESWGDQERTGEMIPHQKTMAMKMPLVGGKGVAKEKKYLQLQYQFSCRFS